MQTSVSARTAAISLPTQTTHRSPYHGFTTSVSGPDGSPKRTVRSGTPALQHDRELLPLTTQRTQRRAEPRFDVKSRVRWDRQGGPRSSSGAVGQRSILPRIGLDRTLRDVVRERTELRDVDVAATTARAAAANRGRCSVDGG